MGERLRAIRKAQRLTLKALSARSGVALSTLSKIELGQISVSYEKLAAVARALDVDIAALFDPRAGAAPARGRRPVVVRSTLDDGAELRRRELRLPHARDRASRPSA